LKTSNVARLFSLSAHACVLAILTGCSSSQPTRVPEQKNISVRFPIPIVEAAQAPFYVAQDLGYYSEEQLTVRFEMGSRELNPVKQVATGADTFGVLGGPDTLMVARSAGQPLRAVAVLHRNSNFPCVITLQDSGITDPHQLEGKKVGFFYGHISTDVIRNLFRKLDVKVDEVDVGFDYTQLINKQIAAEWAFTVTAGLDLPAKGVAINIISPAQYGIVTHGYTIFATETTLSTQPEAVTAFLRATFRGVEYTLAHPEEANKAIIRRDPTIDEALSLKRLLAYNAVTSHGPATPIGYMDLPMFKTTYDRLAEENVITKPFNPADAFTISFLDRAKN